MNIHEFQAKDVLRRVGVPIPPGRVAKTPDEARQKAARLLKEVQSGRDFGVVAKESSEDPSSGPAGGDLNFQPLQAIENIDPRTRM